MLGVACSKTQTTRADLETSQSIQEDTSPAAPAKPANPAAPNPQVPPAANKKAVDEAKLQKQRETENRLKREQRVKDEANELNSVDLAGLEQRAAAGDKNAQTDLGTLYYEGRRVPKDLKRAAQLWAAAARQGQPVAAENLRLLQLKDDKQEVDDSIAFFGTKSKGRRFVFIIDKSGSMTGPRFRAARMELIKTLRALPGRAFFMIYFFNDVSEGMPVRNMLAATPKNIEWAVKWVESRKPFGGTDPSRALWNSFQIQPDTIWLLSDGQFTDADSVIQQIRNANRVRAARINTLAFHNPIGEAVLKIIARENDGTYRFVKP